MPTFQSSMPPQPEMTYGGPTPAFDFQGREQELAQRKRKLAELMKMAQMGEQPKGQMVGGHFVAPSIFEQLAPLAKQIAGQYATSQEEKGLAKDQAEYSEADRRAAIEHAMSRPQATPEQAGPTDPNNPTELQGYTPSQQEMVGWAQKGANIPSRRDVVAKLLQDIEVSAPVRAEDRAYRSQESSVARADKSAEAAQARADKAEEAEKARIERGEQAAADRVAAAERGREAAGNRSADLRYTTDQNNETRRQMIAAGLEKAAAATNAKEKAKDETKSGDAREVLSLLNDATALIPEATSSGMGNAVDAGLGFFGKSTGGADAAARMKVIGGLLTSKMPKMSGPQSDKDVALYKEMAGKLGDPTVPVSQKQAAAQQIYEINKRYAHLNTGQDAPAAPTAPVAVTSPDEARKLKPGTRFTTPDGRVFTR